MTKSEREQSLVNARRACEWLAAYTEGQDDIYAGEKLEVECLIAEFKRLDKNASRPRAGRPRVETDNPKTLAQRRWRDKEKLESK